MIFGKGKKDGDSNLFSRPLESAAINRWRSVDASGEDLNKKKSSPQFETSDISPLKLNISVEDTQEEVFTLQEEYNEPELFEELSTFSKEDDDFQEEIFDENDYSAPGFQEEHIDEMKVEPVPDHLVQVPREKTPASDFSKDVEQDIKDRFGSNLKSALGSGTVIEGMFSFENPVKIDGVLRGEIRSTSALIVGPSAEVHARIQVGSLIVLGVVEGEIEAQDLIEVRSTGSLQGDVVTRRLALEEGGFFNGACTMID
jgi:cytoskeletal protein CcmA (bactofilin family)